MLRRHPAPEPPDPADLTHHGIDLGLGWTATAPRRPPWLSPDETHAGPDFYAPSLPSRVPTLDFRKGYKEAWALRRRMTSVARPYLLRTSLVRLGAQEAPEPWEGLDGGGPIRGRP